MLIKDISIVFTCVSALVIPECLQQILNRRLFVLRLKVGFLSLYWTSLFHHLSALMNQLLHPSINFQASRVATTGIASDLSSVRLMVLILWHANIFLHIPWLLNCCYFTSVNIAPLLFFNADSFSTAWLAAVCMIAIFNLFKVISVQDVFSSFAKSH